MIYTKPVGEISWDDVVSFCERRIAERSNLDYKEDFPGKLEKTIAAMANTFGGLVLIGVEQDDENRPVLPVKGIAFRRGLSERVTGIVLTNITPPLVPETAVCPDSSGQKAVVVIRVPQSHQTPHAIAENTKVYVRTGDLNTPEQLARVDELGWLLDQRSKSVALREHLYVRAGERYEHFADVVEHRVQQERGSRLVPRNGVLSLSLCPVYPRESYRTPPELVGVHQRIRVRDRLETGYTFPPHDMLRSGKGTIVQDGVVLVSYHCPEGHPDVRFFYTEVGSLGLYYYRQPIWRTLVSIEGAQRHQLWAGEIIVRLHEFIESAGKFYEDIGFWGYLQFDVELTQIRGHWLEMERPGKDPFADLGSPSPDEDSRFSDVVLAGSLQTGRTALVLGAVQRIGWAFGLNLDSTQIENSWQKLGR